MPIPKGPNCFGDVMGEFKRGELHSGKDGPTVKNRKQAKAIASSMCNNSEDLEPDHGCGCPHAEKEKKDKKKKMMALGYSEEAVNAVLDDMEAKYGENKGLWHNIHKKRERIKRGSGERMRKPGEKGAPTEKDLKDSQSED